jgi:pilus assembly protein Flp/PilA
MARIGHHRNVRPRPGDGRLNLSQAPGEQAPAVKEGTRPMSMFDRFLAPRRRDEEGQGLAEYALILALIAIVAIIALIFLGGQVSTILSTVGSSV